MPLFASLTLVKETALTRGCFSKISVTDFVYRKRTPSYRPTQFIYSSDAEYSPRI